MASFINTNVSSLNAQRNLGMSQSSLATSMQRLSSGLRINSAKDDAAGLAISERMTSQVRGLNQAARNANDGISLAQTAEGALGQVSDNLQRIRELAVQSRNGTNNATDRAAIQQEVSQLKSEIGRVARDTAFNGTNLLDGSFTGKAFQVGANQGQTITIDSIANANVAQLGTWDSVATASTSGSSGQFTAAAAAAVGDDFTLTVGGVAVATYTATAATDTFIARDLDAQLSSNAATLNAAGITFSGSAAEGNLSFSKTDGSALTIAKTGGMTGGTFATTGFVGTHNNGVASAAQTGFANLDVRTVDGADNAIKAMDAALTAVNDSRANLGAVQNRFSSVVANVQTSAENLTASRSRIQDADFAAETANLSRAQVLQQAGTAMVAQANQLPQGVLALLRG